VDPFLGAIARCSPRPHHRGAHVRTSQMALFRQPRMLRSRPGHFHGVRRLPPAFSRRFVIEGQLYWEASFSPTTPTEAIFPDTIQRATSLVLRRPHVLNADGPEPTTIWEVLNPEGPSSSSSAVRHPHRPPAAGNPAAHVCPSWSSLITPGARAQAHRPVQSLARLRLVTRMHWVLLLAPALDNGNHTKESISSPRGPDSSNAGSGLLRYPPAFATAPWRTKGRSARRRDRSPADPGSAR